jgi:AcrR family transcriptional regulator
MEKEKTDKKDHILDVAERVFSEKGFDGSSTRLISGEAGVNMAMLNYYFGSKEGLFLAIFERKISSFQNIMQNLGNDESLSAWDKMEKYIEMYGEKVVNTNCFQKLLYREMGMSRDSDLSDKLRDMLMKNVAELDKILREGMANGEFRKDVDIPMVIAALYGTKNYILNTPLIASALLKYDIQDQKMIDTKLKPQLKSFMKTLLKCYLLTNNE